MQWSMPDSAESLLESWQGVPFTAKPIVAVYEFVAQLQIFELLDNATFTAGYKAVLHIHSIHEECEIVKLMQQIDPKTRKPMKGKVLFVKNGAVIICHIQQLNGDNYPTWAWAMSKALSAKNKLGFVNVTLTKPTNPSDPLYSAWERCNDMVLSWILNSVTKNIASSILYIDIAADAWKDLKERFSQGNRPRIF
ncbi:hypothetical protein F0562_023921 [Nyssa sinensis]|uniref:Retrotransposon Copia-like N-terminal domain-containing protein n=1 Tax=Nyssa sinensis TaxID=561372 RepID=A0A5J5BJ16_9ASTE|nr:hypothetical protein F0562_023921 [Nyssa sinensis]